MLLATSVLELERDYIFCKNMNPRPVKDVQKLSLQYLHVRTQRYDASNAPTRKYCCQSMAPSTLDIRLTLPVDISSSASSTNRTLTLPCSVLIFTSSPFQPSSSSLNNERSPMKQRRVLSISFTEAHAFSNVV